MNNLNKVEQIVTSDHTIREAYMELAVYLEIKEDSINPLRDESTFIKTYKVIFVQLQELFVTPTLAKDIFTFIFTLIARIYSAIETQINQEQISFTPNFEFDVLSYYKKLWDLYDITISVETLENMKKREILEEATRYLLWNVTFYENKCQ